MRVIPSLFSFILHLFITVKCTKSGASGIQTQIVGIVGKDNNHYTSTTAHLTLCLHLVQSHYKTYKCSVFIRSVPRYCLELVLTSSGLKFYL